jgi:hypothetical protein
VNRFKVAGETIAQSAGDRRNAPPPDGATEFIDLHHDAALRHGIRYAVAVINAHAGLSFSRLDRAFAGVMLRDDPEGAHSKIAPMLIDYFASGVRPSMYDLALLHAAARCNQVFVRHATGFGQYVRRPSESAVDFHRRMIGEQPDEPRSRPPRAEGPPLFAALVHGDLALPEGSEVFTLTRERVVPTLAASDLIS